MEKSNDNKSVLEICKEYYENLDRSELDTITPERGKEIFEFADIYRGIHENDKYDKAIENRFETSVQKLLSCKNNVLSLVTYSIVEEDNKMKSQKVSKSIQLNNDAEKILFVIRSIDPENKLFKYWNDIIRTLTNDTSSFLISASNYSKAKKIMTLYYNGFFYLKLILDEQSFLTYSTKLAEQEIENGLKK